MVAQMGKELARRRAQGWERRTSFHQHQFLTEYAFNRSAFKQPLKGTCWVIKAKPSACTKRYFPALIFPSVRHMLYFPFNRIHPSPYSILPRCLMCLQSVLMFNVTTAHLVKGPVALWSHNCCSSSIALSSIWVPPPFSQFSTTMLVNLSKLPLFTYLPTRRYSIF